MCCAVEITAPPRSVTRGRPCPRRLVRPRRKGSIGDPRKARCTSAGDRPGRARSARKGLATPSLPRCNRLWLHGELGHRMLRRLGFNEHHASHSRAYGARVLTPMISCAVAISNAGVRWDLATVTPTPLWPWRTGCVSDGARPDRVRVLRHRSHAFLARGFDAWSCVCCHPRMAATVISPATPAKLLLMVGSADCRAPSPAHAFAQRRTLASRPAAGPHHRDMWNELEEAADLFSALLERRR